MRDTLSVADAKARFSGCIAAAAKGESIMITRYGKPIAALVPAGDLEDMERLRAARPQGLASIVGGWDGSGELADSIEKVWRSRSRKIRRSRKA